MKRVFVCFLLFLFICASGMILLNFSKGSNKLSRYEDFDAPAMTVERFWKYSLEGNQNALRDLLTTMPRSFSNKKSRCRSSSEVEAVQNGNNSQAEAIFATNSGEFDDWIKTSLEFSSIIKDSNYQLTGNSIESIFEREAIIKARYETGGIDQPLYFLLYQENTKWKIFAITDGYAVFNPNYANGKCE